MMPTPKPMKQPAVTPACTKLTLRVGVRANIGNYEDVQVEAAEEYSIDATMNVGDTRRILMSNLVKFLQTETARMLEPLNIPREGKSSAGQLAVYLKEMQIS